MSKKYIDNPLSKLIQTKQVFLYKKNNNHVTMNFENSIYNGILYSNIIWDLQKNTLTFYTQDNTVFRHNMCILFNIIECKQIYKNISNNEIDFFIKQSINLCKKIINNDKIRTFKTLSNNNIQHYITLIGETHVNFTLEDSNYLYDNICLFLDTFVEKKIVIDFFIENNPNREYLKYTGEEMIDKLTRKYDGSGYIKTHLVDIRYFIRNLQDFTLVYDIILNMYTDMRLNRNVKHFLQLLYKKIKYKLLPVLDIKNNDSYIYLIKKQFYKMDDNIDYIFHDIFKNVVLLLKNFITVIDFIDSNDYDYNNLPPYIIQKIRNFTDKMTKFFIMSDTRLILMDLYTIGRMLKQNNTFSVFYGGGHHCSDIGNLLLKYKNFNLDINENKSEEFVAFHNRHTNPLDLLDPVL